MKHQHTNTLGAALLISLVAIGLMISVVYGLHALTAQVSEQEYFQQTPETPAEEIMKEYQMPQNDAMNMIGVPNAEMQQMMQQATGWNPSENQQ